MFKRLVGKVHAAQRRLGQRGEVLQAFAFLCVLFATLAVLTPTTNTGDYNLYALTPVWFRVLLWLIPATIGLIAAYRENDDDKMGFRALWLIFTLMFVNYLFSSVAFLVGIGESSRYTVFAGIFGIVSYFLYKTAGWPSVSTEPIAANTHVPELREQTALIFHEETVKDTRDDS